MMKPCRIQATVLILIGRLAVPARAQVVPGRVVQVSRRFGHLSKRRNYE